MLTKLRSTVAFLFIACVLHPQASFARVRQADSDPRGNRPALAREASLKARQADVDAAQRDVERCETDLQKAQAKGNTAKIEKRKADLAKAHKRFEDAAANLTR